MNPLRKKIFAPKDIDSLLDLSKGGISTDNCNSENNVSLFDIVKMHQYDKREKKK